MSYIKGTYKRLVLPHVIDFRMFPELSKKAVDHTIDEQDYLFWLKATGRDIVYETIKISKDRISRKLRALILNKYNNKCVKCGSEQNLQVDHIKPERLGGETVEENLQILCKSCNCKKGCKYEV